MKAANPSNFQALVIFGLHVIIGALFYLVVKDDMNADQRDVMKDYTKNLFKDWNSEVLKNVNDL